MITVYHEIRPESYLLFLTPGAPAGREYALAYCLRRACRSGKTAVWVDCELVAALSTEARRTLWNYHSKLHKRHQKLIVVHASDEVRKDLLNWELAPSLCFATDLFDPARQSGPWKMG